MQKYGNSCAKGKILSSIFTNNCCNFLKYTKKIGPGIPIAVHRKTLTSPTGVKCLSSDQDCSFTAVTSAKRPTCEREKTVSKMQTVTNRGIWLITTDTFASLATGLPSCWRRPIRHWQSWDIWSDTTRVGYRHCSMVTTLSRETLSLPFSSVKLSLLKCHITGGGEKRTSTTTKM